MVKKIICQNLPLTICHLYDIFINKFLYFPTYIKGVDMPIPTTFEPDFLKAAKDVKWGSERKKMMSVGHYIDMPESTFRSWHSVDNCDQSSLSKNNHSKIRVTIKKIESDKNEELKFSYLIVEGKGVIKKVFPSLFFNYRTGYKC
ncbi:hypothetical protein GF382_03810 [Candidatus Falkowbacteria bacterium]|nr:hypothetical protein [Candidatus Falkowbacteria bacterium]